MTETLRSTTPIGASPKGPVPVLALGMSLSLFLLISYLISHVLLWIVPGIVANDPVIAHFILGRDPMSWTGFLIGAFRAVACGWIIALIFAPLYNDFATRWRR